MPDLTVDLVERFYAILAMLAIVFIVIVTTVRILAVGSDPALDVYASIARAIEPRAIAAAWVVALLATGGSLYFSEVAGFVPCTLCWYQRIAMYPLVVILGVALIRRDRRVALGASALAVIGAAIAGYHVALEWIPSLDSGACAAAAPCTYVWFRAYGVFSLPTLALTAFLLILAFLRIRDPDIADGWSDR